jgi:Tol biopolymer transport system component
VRRSAVTALVALALLPSGAGATYPGGDGAVAFQSIHQGNCGARGPFCDEAFEIEVKRRALEETRLLVCDAVAPSFSADGRRLAFSRPSGGIWTARADGTGATVVPGTADGFAPVWSPSGKRLFFTMRSGSRPDFDLATIHADGTQHQRLTHDGRSVAEDWSVTGRLLFSRVRSRLGLFSLSPNGTHERRLTRPGTLRSDPARPAADSDASWSPDASAIAFTRDSDFVKDVFVARADGRDAHSLVHVAESPAWVPNGRMIAYVHIDGSRVLIRKANGTGGANGYARERTNGSQRCGTAGFGHPEGRRLGGVAWQPLPSEWLTAAPAPRAPRRSRRP